MDDRKRIIFVDDQPNVLSGLRRTLRPFHQKWDMVFVQSGAEALESFSKEPFDVIVTDCRMPGMDGAALLTEISRLYPNTVRIILSGQSDQERNLRAVGTAHQYLSKPCDIEILRYTLDRALALRRLLSSDSLMPIVSQIKTLPSLPSVYNELLDELRSEFSSLEKIAKIISRDVGMTAKILQIVNSAFFGLSSNISNVERAIGLLGLDIIKSLVLSVHIFSNIDKSKIAGFSIEDFEKHSLAVGAYAKKIMQIEKCNKDVVSNAFMAGLLHDVGKLIMAMNLPQYYSQALKLASDNNILEWEAENELLHSSHSEIGAYLLGIWGLPDAIVEAVAYHHDPNKSLSRTFDSLTAVHVANAFYHESISQEGDCCRRINMEYIKSLDLCANLENWKADCLSAGEEERVGKR